MKKQFLITECSVSERSTDLLNNSINECVYINIKLVGSGDTTGISNYYIVNEIMKKLETISQK